MTILHIVSWKLAAADPAEKAENAAQMAARLGALVGVVDEIRSLRIGPDVVGGANWDVALVAKFDDEAALGRYQAHPAHVAAGAYVRSVTAERMAVDLVV
ncbi:MULTISPECIES: Dabb family protein [Cryobacterium]|uniref:Dabb family protein n=1 Tax=Cryobacterium TaxID=69578 RepID=UPI000CD3C891|nr:MULTISPECIES: Dabb family protein [Cryobacterium]POH69609.1 stress responsive alpha-beta barrel domain-containing protein [Cryobacterium zongtaii]TFC44302.1 Dabb family protein [Cryobacterium sp. TMN-39-2]